MTIQYDFTAAPAGKLLVEVGNGRYAVDSAADIPDLMDALDNNVQY